MIDLHRMRDVDPAAALRLVEEKGFDAIHQNIEQFLAAIETMMGSALVTTQKVKVIRYGESGPSDKA